jgi:PAS domain S-box-containing protein
MFGYTKAEILNNNIRVLSKNEEIFIEKVFDAVEKNGKWTGEIIFEKKDGTTGISETFLFQYLDAQGDKIALISVNKDITIRKKSEEELK